MRVVGIRQRGLVVGRHVAVVSPHLDDATFSLGAAIADATRAGTQVTVVTVLAGDPASTAPADEWHAACGFATRGEAARVRRGEDARACERLGASSVWLSLDAEASDQELRQEIAPCLDGADAVLVPGYPCSQDDHTRVTRLVLENCPARMLGLYVDQPYAMWRLLGLEPAAGRRGVNLWDAALRRGVFRRLQQPLVPPQLAPYIPEPVSWRTVRATARGWLAKQRAARSYRSQVRAFGPRTLAGIAIYEFGWGGECVGWLES